MLNLPPRLLRSVFSRPFAVGVIVAAGCGARLGGVETVPVFAGGDGKYHSYRIPAVLRAASGTLLAFAEGRKDGAGDTGNIDLLLRRSFDGGRTWSAPAVIMDDDGTCGNPCPVQDASTGTIWLFATRNGVDDHADDIVRGTAKGARTVWVCHSNDDGASWSTPVELTGTLKRPEWRWYATGPGIGIQIQRGPHAGRLVIPCNHSYADPDGNYRNGPFNSGGHVVVSDDHGKSWQLGGSIEPGVNESQVVELAGYPGELLMNSRPLYHVYSRREAWSRDGGRIWTGPVNQLALPDGGRPCQGSILRQRWPAGERPGVLLFSNPNHREQRIKLTVRASEDDGRTWRRQLELHPGFSAYSSLVDLGEDNAGCLYEYGEREGPGRRLIVFARFHLSELKPVTAGE